MSDTPLPFFDPHFHVWDIVDGPHESDALQECCDAAQGGYPTYTIKDYQAEVAEARPLGVALVGGIIIEALPTSDEPTEEYRYVAKHLEANKEALAGRQYHFVGRVNFSRPDAIAECKAALRVGEEGPMRMCGVRHIVNYEPSWPRVKSSLLEDKGWREAVEAGFFAHANAEASHLRVFDVHCNPHQLPAIASLAAAHPDVSFVINHLGCLKIEQDDTNEVVDEKLAAWEAGMTAIAEASKRTYVKLSGASYVQPHDHRDLSCPSKVVPTRMVSILLRLFGSDRLFAATNYPVSHVQGCTPDRYFRWLLHDSAVAQLPRSEKAAILAHNAMRVYLGEVIPGTEYPAVDSASH